MRKYIEWKNYFNSKLHKDEMDVFLGFMILWMGYNSFYNQFSNRIEKDRATKNVNLPPEFYDIIKDEALKIFSEIPSSYEPLLRTCVIDTRPEHNKIDSITNAYYNSGKDSLENMLGAIYQIRCNLFHGDKTPSSEIDKQLVMWAHKYLLIILSEFKSNLFS